MKLQYILHKNIALTPALRARAIAAIRLMIFSKLLLGKVVLVYMNYETLR